MRILFVSVILALILVLPAVHAGTIATGENLGDRILVVESIDNFERHMTITWQRINSTTFNITMTMDPALRTSIQNCLASIATCDRDALKANWIPESKLTLTEILDEVTSMTAMPVTATRGLPSTRTSSVNYLAGFSIVVEFRNPNDQIKIGRNSVLITTGETASTGAIYVTRTINGSQIVVISSQSQTAWISYDGGKTFPHSITSGAGLSSPATEYVGEDTIMVASTGGTKFFNMTHKTWRNGGTISGSPSSVSRPYRLRNGDLVVFTGSGGTSCNIQRSTNNGTTWATATSFTSPFSVCSDGTKVITQSSDGFIWVLKTGGSQGSALLNVSNVTFAQPTTFYQLSTYDAFGGLISTPNGTIHAFSANATSLTQIKISNTDKRVITHRNTTQAWNATNGLTEMGNLVLDVNTDILYIVTNNGTSGTNSRVSVWNITESGMNYNLQRPQYTSDAERAFRPYIGSSRIYYPWPGSPYHLNSSFNTTMDLIMHNNSASFGLVYDNLTIAAGPPPPAPPNVTLLILTAPLNITYFGNTTLNATFFVNDTGLTTINVTARLNGVIIFQNATLGNSTTVNLTLNVTGQPYNFNVTAVGSTNASQAVNFHVFHGVNLSVFQNNGSVITSWNVTIRNSTSAISFTNRNNGFLIDNFLMPGGLVTLNFSKEGFDTEVNSTIVTNTMGVVYLDARLFRQQFFYFRRDGILLNNWTLNITNSTTFNLVKSISNVSSGLIQFSLREVPFQNLSLRADSFGTETATATLEFNANSSYNYTFNASTARFFMFFYDEDTLQPLSNVSVSIFNDTFTVSRSNITNATNFTNLELPTGLMRITVTYQGGVRNYYRQFQDNTSQILNVYFPATGFFFTFYVRSGDLFINGSSLTFQRLINGSFQTVAQYITQIDGSAVVLLKVDVVHKVTVTHPEYQSRIFDYTFSAALVATPITIQLTALTGEGIQAPPTNTFIPSGFVFRIDPNATVVGRGTQVNLSFVDSLSLMSYAYVNVTRYNFSRPSNYFFQNLTGASTISFTVPLNFTASNYQFTYCAFRNNTMYCGSKTYIVQNTTGFFDAQQVESTGGLSVMFFKIIIFFIAAIILALTFPILGAPSLVVTTLIFGVATYPMNIFTIPEFLIILLISLVSLRVMLR